MENMWAGPRKHSKMPVSIRNFRFFLHLWAQELCFMLLFLGPQSLTSFSFAAQAKGPEQGPIGFSVRKGVKGVNKKNAPSLSPVPIYVYV